MRIFVGALSAATVLLAGCGSKSADDSQAGTAPSAAPTSAAPADNGIAALTADQILAKTKAAVKAAKSFNVKGSELDDGQKSTMNFQVAGKELDGTLAMGKATVEILVVGGGQYMKANEAFWATAGDAKSAPAIAKLIGDRWVKVPNDNKDFGELFSIVNIDDLLKSDGTVTKGAATQVDGTPVIELIDGGSPSGTLDVQTVGDPYPVKLTSEDGSLLTFTGFNGTFPAIKKPAAADIVDLSALTS